MIVFGNPTLLQYVEDKVGTNFVVCGAITI